MAEESVLELFDQLCELHLGSPKRCYRKQPLVNRVQAKRQLKTKLYSTLFHHLLGQRSKESKPQGVCRGAEEVLLEVFRLRKRELNKEADRLESLFDQVYHGKNDDLKSCIRLLVALRGTDVMGVQENEVSVTQLNVPEPHSDLGSLNSPKGKKDISLPWETNLYKHYPPELFDFPQSLILTGWESSLLNTFQCDPGVGISEDSILSTTIEPSNEHDGFGPSSFFCGLVQRKPHQINILLDIPELDASPTFKIPEFKVSSSKSSSQLSEESGLGSDPSSMSSSILSVLDQPMASDDAIWELALTESRSQHYTWEWIGYQPGPTERPFLTEAGAKVFDLMIQLRKRVANIADPSSAVVFKPPTCVEEVIRRVLDLLVGVQSWIFPLDMELNKFCITPNLQVSGLTSELLADILTPFLETGTFFHRLSCFARPPIFNSSYRDGHTFAAFLSSLKTFLNHYSAAILQVSPMQTLLQLKIHLQKAMDQIRYLACLCNCDQVSSVDDSREQFPKGMNLLFFLYQETQVSTSSSHYLLMLSLLQMTWAPFVLFVRDWVFHGVLKDVYQEFIIHVDSDCRERKDERYWTGTYRLEEEFQIQDSLPDFLQDLINDIVTCGKSINLLRVCHPQHFMCNLPNRDIPSVIITFSQSDLEAVERYSRAYIVRMRQIAAAVAADRFEIQAKAKQQKKELQLIARKLADDEIKRLQGIIDNRIAKEDEKKREEFQRLKEQMITDLERRANEEKQSKEEDRHYMARLNREEDALTQEEIELEKKARDELIAYYAELSEEAMHRERKALWRLRRGHLDNARAKFLADDAERWRNELGEVSEGREVFNSVQADDLPSWMMKLSDVETPVEVSEQEKINLPKWAEQELPEFRFEPVEDLKEGLPDWAKRSSVEGTLEIGEEDDGENLPEGGSDEVDGNSESISELEKANMSVSTLKKPDLKKIGNRHISQESTDMKPHPHIQTVEGKRISDESTKEIAQDKASIRMVDGTHVLQESEEALQKPHIKASNKFHATLETESAEEKIYIRCQEGISANMQSTEERQIIPHLHRHEHAGHITKESESEALIVKKRSLFGHVSQLSNSDYVVSFPRLRRQTAQQASDETQFKDFGIKPRPRIRMNCEMSATKESDQTDGPLKFRSRIRVFSQHANLESVHVDENKIRIQRFQQRNAQGHSSDSTVQKLLYGSPSQRTPRKKNVEEIPPLPRIELKPGLPHVAEMYAEDFTFDGDLLDINSAVHIVDIEGSLIDSSVMSEEEIEAHKYTPLSVLMGKSIAAPIKAQISLVNGTIVNYFICDLKVEEHFAAIRRYLLMADGDFAEILSNILLEKLSTNPLPREILNPIFLNSTLHKAIGSSIHYDDKYAQNLAWTCKEMPSVLMPNEPQSLKCLELCYKVNWPLNIILTKRAMHKYGMVFSFLLQIKRVVWSLKDVWHRLKRDSLINKVGNSPQFRKLQLHRQEMEHFVKTMQGYIANQVIQVTWQELQTSLSQPVAGLDQLRTLHDRYIDSAVSRCLLDKKAERVMNLIRDIFCLILKFRSQLISASWQQSEQGKTTHANFNSMTESYQSFHAYSLFLFKVVYRLSQKGYQPHLQELLVQLNFNEFYTEAVN